MRAAIPRRLAAASLVLVSSLVAACDDDPVGPTMGDIAGTYEATTWIGIATGGEFDFLANGSSIDIALNSNGTTTGTMFIPDGSDDVGGGDLTADLTGTWTLDGNRLGFDHTGDTFIRNETWTYANGRISLENEVSRVVLTRQ